MKLLQTLKLLVHLRTYICPTSVARYVSTADLRDTEFMKTAGTTLRIVPAAEIQDVVVRKQLSAQLKHLENAELLRRGKLPSQLPSQLCRQLGWLGLDFTMWIVRLKSLIWWKMQCNNACNRMHPLQRLHRLQFASRNLYLREWWFYERIPFWVSDFWGILMEYQ